MAPQPSDTRAPLIHAIRVVWVLIVAITTGIFITSIPVYISKLGQVTYIDQEMIAPFQTTPTQEFASDLISLAALISAGVLNLVLALIIRRRRADDPIAMAVSLVLLLFSLMVGPLETLLTLRPAWLPISWFLDAMLTIPFTILFYLFPNGRFIPRWTRWLALSFIVWLPVTLLVPALQTWRVTEIEQVTPLLLFWVLFWPVSIVVAQIQRYVVSSNAVERQQVRWVVFGMAISTLAFVGLNLTSVIDLGPMEPAPIWFVIIIARRLSFAFVMICLALTMAISILRYRLWAIDILINRTLVFGTLTALVIGLYILIVGVLGAQLQLSGSPALSLIAAGVVAIAFQPLRERLQRGVNRLMYGERDDPYAVLSRLGNRLEEAIAPEAIMQTVVETVAHALKLPYVAVALQDGADNKVVAAYGSDTARPADARITLPLIDQKEVLGYLILKLRSPQEPFTPAEMQLLNDIAHHAGMALHNIHLTTALQRAREHLVLAREEERRRLRRDLHDGLGPQLASQSLKLEAAKDCLRHDPDRAEALLTSIVDKSQGMLADVRRLVYGLRPPALDELGLADALREHVRQSNVNGAEVTLVVSPEELPPLPAAVEVATYRILQEALNNVAQHAHARSCRIAVDVVSAGTRNWLRLDILDDGVGLSQLHHAGVGTMSMRERAEELGGRCMIEPISGGGTRVLAELPMDALHGARHEG